MTKEEYRSHFGLEEQDAQNYLKTLRILTPVFGIALAASALQSLDTTRATWTTINDVIWLAFMALLIIWTVYSVQVLHATKRSGWNVLFSYIIFPLGLIGFYYYLIKPLRIILGELPPPEKFPTEADKKVLNKNAWHAAFRTIGIATAIGLGLLVVLIVVTIASEA